MALTVEDIMCDQSIITLDLNVTTDGEDNRLALPTRKLWLKNVLYTFRNFVVPALAAFLANSLSKSLAPLQRIPLSLPTGVVRIRFRRMSRAKLSITDGVDPPNIEDHCKAQRGRTEPDELPERCVNCTVLHEPEGEPHADVIFIHGLHGGIDRTWTQGTWRQKNPKFRDLAPVRKRSTGDLYVPIQEDSQPRDGRMKRTFIKIYTNIPVRRSDNHVTMNKADQTTNAEQTEEEKENCKEEEAEMENFSRCWPKDWLPQDCPGVRILAINYTTDVLWRPVWQRMKVRTSLPQRTKEMMEDLLRLGVGSRPIVWVGHSKGGLYIKQIILNGSYADEENQSIRNVFLQTKAIMFYSVPHKGSPIADMTFPFFRRSIEVLEVRTNCEFVLNLHRRFLEIYSDKNSKKPEIFSFIDTENTPVGFTSLKFIAYESADPDIGVKCDVPLDHREICKPAGRDCFLYRELVKLINKNIFINET